MKNLTIIVLGVVLLTCQSSISGLTRDEFETKIDSVEKANLAGNKLDDGWYETTTNENDFMRIDKLTQNQYFINPKPIILPDNFFSGEEFENQEGVKGLSVYFDETGIESWARATHDNTDSYLIFILDNEILTVQYVNSQITNGASAFWKSDLTDNQWRRIKSMIKNK